VCALSPAARRRLEYTPDPKLPNAGTFKLEREDHTLGNLLRMQLLEDERVIFVGYKQPHPLLHHIVLRIQTVAGYSPQQALSTCIDCLQAELHRISVDLENSDAHGL
jgi:DNA-directed RNA polymerase II subunit RPB11